MRCFPSPDRTRETPRHTLCTGFVQVASELHSRLGHPVITLLTIPSWFSVALPSVAYRLTGIIVHSHTPYRHPTNDISNERSIVVVSTIVRGSHSLGMVVAVPFDIAFLSSYLDLRPSTFHRTMHTICHSRTKAYDRNQVDACINHRL